MVKAIHSEELYDDPAPYSQGIVHDGIIYLSGLDPADAEHNTIGDDIETQTEAVLSNAELLLEAADSSPSNIISVTAYLTDMADFEGFNAVYEETLPDPKPARTTVAVEDLATDARIELQVIASCE